MPVRDVEAELTALSALRDSADEDARLRALRKGLRDRVNLVVARAAKIGAELQIHSLIPDLCAAFDRMLIDPAKTDPKCWGKEALAKALRDLGHADSAIFAKGAQYVQLEPVWGSEEDTAANLRAICSLALLQCLDLTRDDKLCAMVRLLTDAVPSARRDAALALESLGGREAALLLRLKARMGDIDLSVVGQVFESLLKAEGSAAVPFVSEFLRACNADVREEAALALGASRLPEAVSALIETAGRKPFALELHVIYRALGVSRHESAVEFLITAVRKQRAPEAGEALEALKPFCGSQEIRDKVAAAVSIRSEREIVAEWNRMIALCDAGAERGH